MDFCKYLIFRAALLILLTLTSPAFAGQLSEQEIKKSIVEYVKDHTSWREEQIEVTVFDRIPSSLVTDKSVKYRVRTSSSASFLGRTDFDIDVLSGGDKIRSFRLAADIAIWVDVLLTSRPVKTGDMIREEDVYVGKRDLRDLHSGYLANPSAAVGMKAKYFVAANAALLEGNLKPSPVFQRGDRVYIVAESDSLKIMALGEAREEGYKGKFVRVMNLQSRKEIRGTVTEDGLVHVLF